MLPVGNVQLQTLGGYIDGDGGVGKNRGDIFNNQQQREAEMEGSGGTARMGGDDNRAHQ